MGTLRLRDLKKIHANGRRSTNESYFTYAAYAEYSYPEKARFRVLDNVYISNGCCTNLKYVKTPLNYNREFEWVFMKYRLADLPEMYKDKKVLQEWVTFVNEMVNFSDIRIVQHDTAETLDANFWNERNIEFELEKGFVIFAIKKTTLANSSYKNLFLVSLIRAIAHPMYYFVVYDSLRLRKLKSLKDLSNWEIINLTRFAVQTNSTDHSLHNNEAFLYNYRFPLYLSHIPMTYPTVEKLTQKLDNNGSQNTSCVKDYLFIDPIYLMSLFQSRQYLKLHKLINDPKHAVTVNDLKYREKLNAFNKVLGVGSNGVFDTLNNRKIDYKEYEKQLQA